jgi:hypothetical protein
MKFNAFRWPGLFLVFVLVWFFVLSLRQLLDYDIWFQLLAGQETVRTMTVPKVEFYIYSVLGEPSIFVGWLWGLLLYFAWLVGGYGLVSVFNAFVWAVIFVVAVAAILARIAHEVPLGQSFSQKAQVAAALIGMGVAYQYLVARAVFRAEVTFYLAWVLAVYLSTGIANDKQRLRRFLIAVPLLSWCLGWFHTTSVFMVLLLAGYMLQAAVDRMRDQRSAGFWKFVKTHSWPWLASILAAVVLPCLNPNGVEQVSPLIAGLADVLHRAFVGEPGKAAEQIVHLNLEYRSLADVPGVWRAAILFLVASLVVVWRDRSNRVANVLFLAVGILLSTLHVRALAIWAIFLMVPLGVAIAPMLQKATVDLESKGRGALVTALVVMCCFWNIGTLFNSEAARWGVGYWPDPADEQLLKTIRANMPNGGRIFNWFPLGAYLRWNLGPDFLVAIDGHWTNAKSAAWNAYYDIEDFKDRGLSLIDKWNIRAVYHPVVVPVYGGIHWLPYELANNENWRLVAIDRYGVLFVRAGKGEVDEQTRNVLKIEYWRRVIIEATSIAFGSGKQGNKEYARRVVEYAQERIGETQALLK